MSKYSFFLFFYISNFWYWCMFRVFIILVNANQLSSHFSSPHLCTSFSETHITFIVRLLEVVLNLTDALLILFSDILYFILYNTYCHILKFINFFFYNVSFAINFFLQLFHLQTDFISRCLFCVILASVSLLRHAQSSIFLTIWNTVTVTYKWPCLISLSTVLFLDK